MIFTMLMLYCVVGPSEFYSKLLFGSVLGVGTEIPRPDNGFYVVTKNRLLVRGEDWSCKEAGINVLVLSEGLEASSEMTKVFPVHEFKTAANRLSDYLNAIPQGHTVGKSYSMVDAKSCTM